MSRNKLYTARLEICITKQTKQQLVEEAAEEQITINELIRRMLDSYFS